MFCAAFSTPRDRANLQLNNRRLERKVKELVMQVDDEHLSLTDQKDQVRESLCLLSQMRDTRAVYAESPVPLTLQMSSLFL